MTNALPGTSYAARFDRLLCDCDGVMYLGQTLVPGADTFVNQVQEAGIGVRYVTNNASRRAAYVSEKLGRFGLNVAAEHVYTSAMVGVELLAAKVEQPATVLVVGAPVLLELVAVAGFNAVSAADGYEPETIDAVIQGFSQDIGWRELAAAAHAIAAGATWVATNLDRTIPLERGPAPGNGSLVRAVASAVGFMPPSAGKPEPIMFHSAAAGAKRACVIGDRLDTDIRGGKAAGYDTALVLTGVAGAVDVICAYPEERPNAVFGSLSDLASPDFAASVLEPGAVRAGKARLVINGDGESLELEDWDEDSASGGGVDVLRCVAHWVWSRYPESSAPRDIVERTCGRTRAVLASLDFSTGH